MSFNDEIRAAAGYGRAEHDEASERVEGSIGIGRGGASVSSEAARDDP